MKPISIPARDPRSKPPYCEEHVDFHFSPAQALAVRLLLDALKAGHFMLENGQHVDKTPDAVRWILERVAEEYGVLKATVPSPT